MILCTLCDTRNRAGEKGGNIERGFNPRKDGTRRVENRTVPGDGNI